MKKIRILLADDHDIVLRGLRPLIESEPGWEICGEARNGREAVVMAAELDAQVVVLDVGMPELNGIEATRQIIHARPGTRVLIITGDDAESLVHQVLAAGARGFLLKTECAGKIVPAIKALCEQKSYLNSRAAEVVLESYLIGGIEPGQASPGGLTVREREIVQFLAGGLSNKEVAAQLGVSAKTVESHRAAIMRKLGFTAFSELVRYAVRNHFVEP
ncbi:MAG: response regulator transcription factor [Chthoniobacteraceae bacterium]